jgi:prepilin-type N-terminal cleavage/methylation domain-containing protein
MRQHHSRPKQQSCARGVTLFEVLIVVAIIALVSGSVGIAAIKYWGDAQVRTTESNARAIRGAVKAWWIDHDRAQCPGVDELITAGTLDRDSPRRDAWGESWQVECNGDDVTVVSLGRDRRLGTSDDIRIPPT